MQAHQNTHTNKHNSKYKVTMTHPLMDGTLISKGADPGIPQSVNQSFFFITITLNLSRIIVHHEKAVYGISSTSFRLIV